MIGSRARRAADERERSRKSPPEREPGSLAGKRGRAAAIANAGEATKLGRESRRMVLARTARDLKPYRKAMAIGAVTIVAATLARLVGPYLIRVGIDQGVMRGTEGLGTLNVAAVLWVASAAIAYVLGRVQLWMISATGERFLYDLRVRVFTHIQSMHLDFFHQERTGRLIARMTSDVESLQHFVSQGLIVIVYSVVTFFLTLAFMLSLSWELTLATLGVLPPLVIASIVFRRRANPAYLRVRERIAAVLTRLQENLTGIRAVQAFGRESVDAEIFSGANESHYQAQMRTAKLSAFYFPVVEFLGLAGTILVIGFGGYLSLTGRIGLGVVAAFMLYLGSLFDPIQQVSQLYNDMQAAGAALEKLYTLLDEEPRVVDADDATELESVEGRIELDGVSFGYEEGRDVLHDVTLRIEPGTRLALVGQTGAGKSTIAKLVARFYDPGTGSVTLDGHDLKQVTGSSLRRRLVVLPQESFLFSGTVCENIAYGDLTKGREEAEEALRSLGVLDVFERLPEGIDTEVSERGGQLSAGQRQLVGLARAYLADPRVLILDEATSSLDPATGAAVEDALDSLLAGRTSITIAHRLSTAARADLIALVEEGRLTELGSHDELMGKGGRYAALYETWSGQRRAG